MTKKHIKTEGFAPNTFQKVVRIHHYGGVNYSCVMYVWGD
ncbi:MAG: hypothetical protein BWX99_02951 [Deltaproteobacteria bacterium ADurb.Bin151]|nr:MAG: hypothetical protein BWX99_02951 [Deltaproteobacteria bacterium ADurb.Bin151]